MRTEIRIEFLVEENFCRSRTTKNFSFPLRSRTGNNRADPGAQSSPPTLYSGIYIYFVFMRDIFNSEFYI